MTRKNEAAAERAAAPAKKEAVYTAEEFIAGHKAFGASPEIVKVALMTAGIDKATKAQAAKVVEEFRHRKTC